MRKPARIHFSCPINSLSSLRERLQLFLLRLGPTTQAFVEVKQNVSNNALNKQTIVGHPAVSVNWGFG